MLFQPVFMDCNRVKITGHWLVEAEDSDQAYRNAFYYLHNASNEVKPFLVPHMNAVTFVGVKEVKFQDGIAFI